MDYDIYILNSFLKFVHGIDFIVNTVAHIKPTFNKNERRMLVENSIQLMLRWYIEKICLDVSQLSAVRH